MKTEIKTWEDFEKASLRIISEMRERKEKTKRHMYYPLFRGQSNSNWPLESSLGRIQKEMSFDHYQRIIMIVRKHIETCTGKKWELSEKIFLERGLELNEYEFMAYLRHNEFPSPLLDWSRSPYIAAYFAFSDIYLMSKGVKFVSIFVFPEHRLYGDNPYIRSLGPTIDTHLNHYLQQSEYTICVKRQKDKIYFDENKAVCDKKQKNEICFGDYEAVKNGGNQGPMIKYNIPATEQSKVLRKLDSMNITAYSLFGSESSLMETLAIREICFQKWDRLLASKNE
jgi:hypothetical protein